LAVRTDGLRWHMQSTEPTSLRLGYVSGKGQALDIETPITAA
jgi:hypothetical protein